MRELRGHVPATLLEDLDREKYEFMKEHSERLRRWREENLRIRDDMAFANSYKRSLQIITLDVAIIAAMAFLLKDASSLSLVAKLLVLIVLIAPIVSVILSLIYQNHVLELNRRSADMRITVIDSSRAFARERMTQQHASRGDLHNDFRAIDEGEKKGFADADRMLAINNTFLTRLGRTADSCLIAALIAIATLTLMQSGLISC